tara:strand:+ start:1319 stop:2020 length:702 start_codon:yes stop_codon:yes gene_type:complete
MKRKQRTSVIIDVETSGLPKRQQGPGYPSIKSSLKSYDGSRIVQLAWIIVKEKGGENKIESVKKSHIIKPVGFNIPRETVIIHGISTERAQEEGVEIGSVLKEFATDVTNFGVTHIVAHNLEFDKHVLAAEAWRLQLAGGSVDINKEELVNLYNRLAEETASNKLKEVCTMEVGRDYAKIPLPSNPKKYKAPKLGELHQSFTGRIMREKHDAMYDTEKCLECYIYMRKSVCVA